MSDMRRVPIALREINKEELKPEFLRNFEHNQTYNRIWERQDGRWSLKETSVVRAWDEEKRLWIPQYLSEKLENGGFMLGAFAEDKLAGFITMDGVFGGFRYQYLNLVMFFVDDRYQRKGIGRKLFEEGVKRASDMGAEKIFISAIPSEETIAFYFAMGCRDADEIITEFVDTPNDRYLEFELSGKDECA